MGVAAGVGGQARRDKSEIGAVTRFRDMFHKFGNTFGGFVPPVVTLSVCGKLGPMLAP